MQSFTHNMTSGENCDERIEVAHMTAARKGRGKGGRTQRTDRLNALHNPTLPTRRTYKGKNVNGDLTHFGSSAMWEDGKLLCMQFHFLCRRAYFLFSHSRFWSGAATLAKGQDMGQY
jgi:hypothetical protein